GKTLLHGDVLMWLMKTLLTSGCTNQRGAGQDLYHAPSAQKSAKSERKKENKVPNKPKCIPASKRAPKTK
ncbi:hypothetical protein ABQ428_12260, partial [Citrobacter freundii]